MKNFIAIFKEQWKYRKLILHITLYNIKSQYANHYLGVLWDIITPLSRVLVYYIVFGLGLRAARGDVGEVPFLIHLISGIFPWLFISSGLISASSSILSQVGLITKMRFPSSILISISLMGSLTNLISTSIVMLIISLINGYSTPLHYLVFFYFVVASMSFLFGFALIFSSIMILVRDVKNILQNSIRLFFFMTPIIWTLDQAAPILVTITNFNPLAYLVMVYRYAFIVSEDSFYGGISHHLFFWSLTLLMIYIGVMIHYRFRDKFVDYIR